MGQLGDSSSVAAAFNFLQKRYRERKETEDLWSSLRIWRTSRLDKQTFGFLKSVIGLLASVDPTNSRSAVTPGVLLLRAGNTAGGLELLERNVESGSGSRIDHAYLALAQATAHRWEGVNEYFSKHTSYQMGSSSVEVYLVEAEIMQILKKAGRKIEPSKAASDQKFDSDPVGR